MPNERLKQSMPGSATTTPSSGFSNLLGRLLRAGEGEPWSGPLLLAMVAGLFLIVLFAWSRSDHVGSAATALLIAGASLAAGCLVGFLFGIPRAVQTPSPAGDDARESTRDQPDYAVNTNLEQISDWLTKIIIGLGLFQLSKIPSAFAALAAYLANAFGVPSVPSSWVAAALAYFGTCGFLSGYLWTRLFLSGEFSRADRRARGSPEYYEGLIHALLYQPPPDGFKAAIKEGEAYLKRFGLGNYRIWLYLASAYAQKYEFLKAGGKPEPDELERVREQALDATRRVIDLNPTERASLRALWDRAKTTPQENDLEVFYDDPEFKKILG